MKSILAAILLITGSTSIVVEKSQIVPGVEMTSLRKNTMILGRDMIAEPQEASNTLKTSSEKCKDIKCWSEFLESKKK